MNDARDAALDDYAEQRADEGEWRANAGDEEGAENAFTDAESRGARGAARAAGARQRSQAATQEARGARAGGDAAMSPVSRERRRAEREQTRGTEAQPGQGAGGGDEQMRQAIRDRVEHVSENATSGAGRHSAKVLAEHVQENAGGRLRDAGTATQVAAGVGLAAKMHVAGAMDNAEHMQKAGVVEATSSTAATIGNSMALGAALLTSPKAIAGIVSGGLTLLAATGAMSGGTGTAAAIATRAGLRAGVRVGASALAKGAQWMMKGGRVGQFFGKGLKNMGNYLDEFNDEMASWDRYMTGGLLNSGEAAALALVRGEGLAGAKYALKREGGKTLDQWKNGWIGRSLGWSKDTAVATTRAAQSGIQKVARASEKIGGEVGTRGVQKGLVDPTVESARAQLMKQLNVTQNSIRTVQLKIRQNAFIQGKSRRRYMTERAGLGTARVGIKGGYAALQTGAMVGGAALKMVGRATMAGLGGVHSGQPVAAASIGVITNELTAAGKKDKPGGAKAEHALEKDARAGRGNIAQQMAKSFKPPSQAKETPAAARAAAAQKGKGRKSARER